MIRIRCNGSLVGRKLGRQGGGEVFLVALFSADWLIGSAND